MKIYYTFPLELTQTPIEADTDKDFEKSHVGTFGIVESNKFLVSLWNQLNTKLYPENSIGRVPWAYSPGRYSDKKHQVSVIGFAQTRIGELYFALMYKKKGDVDTILYMRPGKKLKQNEIDLISQLVKTAIERKDITRKFVCEAKIELHLKGVTFANYYTTSFSLLSSENGMGVIRFNIVAIDRFEAEQIALNKLYDTCAFLTVETNVLCTFDEFSVIEGSLPNASNDEYVFINDYIDNNPVTEEWKLCLSQYGLSFLEQNIFINDRFEEHDDRIKFFLSSCKHCQIGLESELKLGASSFAVLPTHAISLAKRDQKRKSENITSALMSYLSAVECATVNDTKSETCKECGAMKYKISARVKDLATEYLGEDLGRLFNKLYDYRSKFLHTGKFAMDLNTIRTIPLLSSYSPSGLVGTDIISVQIDGKSFGCSISNVKEWTFYMLRSYYQKRIMKREEFVDVFQKAQSLKNTNLPIKIYAASPEGALIMKKGLVPTHTMSYKTKSLFRKIFNEIQYRIYRKRKR